MIRRFSKRCWAILQWGTDMKDELLKFAQAAHPEILDKVAASLVILEKMYPEDAGDVKENIAFILGKTEEGIKTASGLPDKASLGRFGLAVGASAAAGLATAVVSDLYDEVKRGLSSGRNFKNIINTNPDLVQAFGKSRLKSTFNLVHRYAPEFTADPIMGGAILKNLSEMPQVEHTMVEKLINARKNLVEAKRKQYSPGHLNVDVFDTPKSKDKTKGP